MDSRQKVVGRGRWQKNGGVERFYDSKKRSINKTYPNPTIFHTAIDDVTDTIREPDASGIMINAFLGVVHLLQNNK